MGRIPCPASSFASVTVVADSAMKLRERTNIESFCSRTTSSRSYSCWIKKLQSSELSKAWEAHWESRQEHHKPIFVTPRTLKKTCSEDHEFLKDMGRSRQGCELPATLHFHRETSTKTSKHSRKRTRMLRTRLRTRDIAPHDVDGVCLRRNQCDCNVCDT